MKRPDVLKLSFEFSSKLGVRDLPELGAERQSNIPGLYVVGDLADAPIIKVALNQGYDVAQRVFEGLGPNTDEALLDVVVVGAGPAGIGAALALQERAARFIVVEKEQPFNTIQNFPKAKLIFSEPRAVQNRGNFWFEDARKEELIDRWEQALEKKELPIAQPEEVLDIQRRGDAFEVRVKGSSQQQKTYRARRVILATGRRGEVNRLNIPGERLDKVDYSLKDPEALRGRRLMVVGGGDSAVESAIACAEAGATVTVVYRGDAFIRAKAKNRDRIEGLIESGRISAEMGATPVEIREDTVVLKRGEELVEVANDHVLIFIGTKLPNAFLKRVGIRLAGEMTAKRAAWVTCFALITFLFYVLKAKKEFFPFGPGHALGFLPDALKVDLGWRAVDASFWGTALYSLLILAFGIRAYRRYPSPVQKTRYVSLITFQLVFLFGIPELIAPLVIDRPWKIYAATVPWPLSVWSLVDAPSWAGGSTFAAVGWLLVGVFSAFVAIPLYVRWQGLRFCSYLCGCGGLAETLGDMWRHLAPRGLTSYKSEWAGRIIFIAAIPVTLLILNDAWALFAADSLRASKNFAQNWYGLMVDFWLASVVGVALYPYLGNRVWCRFFCPLRAWMEVLARRFSKIAIHSNNKCIGCGECTRYCQMGIAVQKFAQQQTELHNGNSSCIQCGICIQVCPMEVLSVRGRQDLGRRGSAPGSSTGALPILQPSYGPPGLRSGSGFDAAASGQQRPGSSLRARPTKQMLRAWMFLGVTALFSEESTAANFDHQHATLHGVLAKHVRGGRVDYAALHAHRDDLDRYVRSLAKVTAAEYQKFSREQAMAFWINAYNALTLKLIIDERPKKSIRDLKKPWDRPKYPVAGRSVSLNDIEHQILRKRYPDARLHAVLVCAAKSCPILTSHAYLPNALERQLDAAARRWVRDPSRNRYDPDARTLKVSMILDWYGADFIPKYAAKGGGTDQKAAARGFVAAYLGQSIPPHTTVSYLHYDWSLNGTW